MAMWELHDGKAQIGPLDEAHVLRMIGAGLPEGTLARKAGETEWKGLRSWPAFALALEGRARSAPMLPVAPTMVPFTATLVPRSPRSAYAWAIPAGVGVAALCVGIAIVAGASGTASSPVPAPVPVREEPTQAPPVAVDRELPPPRSNTEAADFLRWVASNRRAPQKIHGEEPTCETTGPTRGLCSVDFFPSDADPTNNYTAKYFKAAPTAARFDTHLDGDVSCSALGAVLIRAWRERAGPLGAAGESCEFHDGPLKDLRVLIEKNRNNDGKFWPGVYVYSSDYLTRDTDFAESVRTDEAR